MDEAGTTSDVLSPMTAQEHEGEPITPPPTAGGDQFVASAESDQYGLWLDGSNDRTWSMPPPPQAASTPLYRYGGQQNGFGPTTTQSNNQQQPHSDQPPPQAPTGGRPPKPVITIEQLVQKAFYPPVKPSEVQLPKQMPWVLSFPNTDRIWRNDDPTVAKAQTAWSVLPFGDHMMYPDIDYV